MVHEIGSRYLNRCPCPVAMMLQLVEARTPEPIPQYPEGHFAVGEERAEYLNSLPTE